MTIEAHHIGSTINVLILSDRLIDCAWELSDYIQSYAESIKVIGIATNTTEVMQIAEKQSVDFLIVAGYLKNVSSYSAVKKLWEWKNCIPVHWAIIDSLIIDYCRRYRIRLMFDRTLPKADFISFLLEHKYDKNVYENDPPHIRVTIKGINKEFANVHELPQLPNVLNVAESNKKLPGSVRQFLISLFGEK